MSIFPPLDFTPGREPDRQQTNANEPLAQLEAWQQSGLIVFLQSSDAGAWALMLKDSHSMITVHISVRPTAIEAIRAAQEDYRR